MLNTVKKYIYCVTCYDFRQTFVQRTTANWCRNSTRRARPGSSTKSVVSARVSDKLLWFEITFVWSGPVRVGEFYTHLAHYVATCAFSTNSLRRRHRCCCCCCCWEFASVVSAAHQIKIFMVWFTKMNKFLRDLRLAACSHNASHFAFVFATLTRDHQATIPRYVPTDEAIWFTTGRKNILDLPCVHHFRPFCRLSFNWSLIND